MRYLLALLTPLSFWICQWFNITLWLIGLILLPTILSRGNQYWGKLLIWPAIILGLIALALQSEQAILFYPIAINFSLLTAFLFSLYQAPPIIEKIARFQHPNFPDSEIPYTRKCTKAWAVFFAFNGLIALGTALLEDRQYWTLYNGAISYMLIGAMLFGEWLIRQKRLKRA
jgi:uncharacterized membrane protein